MKSSILRHWLRILITCDYLLLFFISIPVLAFYSFIDKESDYTLKYSLFLLFISLLSLQVATLHIRYKTEEFLYLSIISTYKIIQMQVLMSIFLTLPFSLLMLFFLLFKFPEASIISLILIVITSSILAIIMGICMGNVVRNRGLSMAILIFFFLVCGMAYWSVHEKFRFLSPILNLFNPYKLNIRNVIGVAMGSILMFFLAVRFSRRFDNKKHNWVSLGAVMVMICCFAVLWRFEIWRDNQINDSSYKVVRDGKVTVFYKGITKDEACQFAALEDAIIQEANKLEVKTNMYPIYITRYFHTPAWNATDRPIQIIDNHMKLNLYSNKHFDFNYGTDWAKEFINQMVVVDKVTTKSELKNDEQKKHIIYTEVMKRNPANIYVSSRIEYEK